MGRLLLIVLCCVSYFSFAQIDKGDIGLGGSGYGSYSKSDDHRFIHVGFSPEIGYFVFNKFMVGALVGYNYSEAKVRDQVSTNDFVLHYYQFGPFIRYYQPISNQWFFLGHAGYVWSWSYDPVDNEKSTYSDHYLALGIGNFIRENVSLEGMFYYQRERVLNFQLGFKIYLDRNKSTIED